MWVWVWMRVISNVQHEELIRVNSMTKALLPPRGTYQLGVWWPGNHCHRHLVNKPGAGGGTQGRISTWHYCQLSTNFENFVCEVMRLWCFLWGTRLGLKMLFIPRFFYFWHHFQGRDFTLKWVKVVIRHFCNVLIHVAAFHIVLGTFRESYCYAITLCASACTAVSEDNWVLWFEAQGSSYFLISVLCNVICWNCCFHPAWTSKDQDGDYTHSHCI